MNKNMILAIGITFLFLGLSIQPSIATPQLKKIDVEPDVEGLVAQIRVVINEILQDYGYIPIIRTLGDKILNISDLFGLIIYCIFLLFLLIPVFIIVLILTSLGLGGTYLSINLLWLTLGLAAKMDSDCPPRDSSLSLKSLFSINRTVSSDNSILIGFDECPCMQE